MPPREQNRRMTDVAGVPHPVPARHGACLRQLLGRAGSDSGIRAVILVGSLATGNADALSDVDLLLVTGDDFGGAWSGRHGLHGPDAVACWDQASPDAPGIGVHRWVGGDAILVEALMFAPDSGVRLASPALVLAGDADLVSRLPRRPPIDRGEMTGASNPIEAAYDAFKTLCRDAVRPPRH
jgi:hypothetical protein